MFRFVCLIVCVLFALVAARDRTDPPESKRVLVVVEDGIRGSHAKYFAFLQERGFELTFGNADDKIEFQKYGEFLYDHLILFAPSSDDLGEITAEQVLEFIDDGRSVIIAASSKISDTISEIASECSVEFDTEGSAVIDHFNYQTGDVDHSTIVTSSSNLFSAHKQSIFDASKLKDKAFGFSGVGQDIEEDSPILFPILTAYDSSYSADPNGQIGSPEDVHVAGRRTVLISALQARNNARVIFSGSLDFFSDDFFSRTFTSASSSKDVASGNELLAQDLTLWAFLERGLIRGVNAKHSRQGETETPATYTIKEDIQYSIDLEEWNGSKWVPFEANDVQVEFSMLDPYYRDFLKHTKNGHYVAKFQLPDVYGVFSFRVLYNRVGYSSLDEVVRTPVRPLRHDGYERFIASAFPYYSSAFSMMAGVFVFSWFFLYHKSR